MPIHFMHKSVSFDELIALYAVSDACLVSSTRDGMNLVSYEYIATQEKRHGVMILSEFTGAAQSLNGSLIVNPWNTEELADAIHDAVTMSEEQRAINYGKLSRYVKKYTRYVLTPVQLLLFVSLIQTVLGGAIHLSQSWTASAVRLER
jgi:trehalose 6-phosphate synthase